MTKIRKVKRSKHYRYSVNRKRLRDKLSKLPKIQCKPIQKEWKKGRSVETNLSEMGLACDPNKSLVIPTIKTVLHPQDNRDSKQMGSPPKKHVAEQLELDARLPRVKEFKLPSSTVHWLKYLVKRYNDDYEAMARDPKNHYQETARQIKAKLRRMNASNNKL